ncbi:hypothetical protein RND71_010228 [Anisodus tanguticus]|uniref:Uncharacterized protein n=1 Tax=Anisodus tanguticus TaxID=243964 RepID=A0AAE1SGS8_9SOLA|nr:hypothetical protein RND71_010228 [Anisodus tanguticus]
MPVKTVEPVSATIAVAIGAKQWLYRSPTCEFDVHLDCLTSAPRQAVQAPASFPGATNQFQQATMGTQARPNQLMHTASTGAITNNYSLQGQVRPNQLFHSASTSALPQQQFLQPPIIQGQVRPNQYMQPAQGENSGFRNGLMNAAIQGLVEGAAQQVGQTFMQGIIGGGDNSGVNEGSSILGSIFGDSSDMQY